MTQVSRRPLAVEIEKRIFDLFLEAVATATTKDRVEDFLGALLSPTEKVMLAKRLAIAFLLFKNYDQRTISRWLKVSLTTVSKVSLTLGHSQSGYWPVIDKIVKSEKMADFWQKIEDFIGEVLPPKSRD
ncbi:MAG: Trp family transcriptional regulator [Candidatus Shapirobacteria bacterium]